MAFYEPFLARVLSDTLLAAWLLGGRHIAARLPAAHTPEAEALEVQRSGSPPLPPSPTTATPAGDDRDKVIHFPQIAEAVRDLKSRNLLTKQAYETAARQARLEAFTVAKLGTLTAVGLVRDALAKNVRDGGTLQDFEQDVEQAFGGTVLAPGHLENVYRTNAAVAYSRGQKSMLQNDLVSSQFPYGEWHAVHDDRVEDTHLAMEKSGIQGTGVYRLDDPALQKVWPPCRWQCRCLVRPMTIREAAERGIVEAIEWLRTGEPPTQPHFVQSVPIVTPPGWHH